MYELKPCPFCGSRARLHANRKEVICPNCECCGPLARNESEAINAWNERIDSVPVPALVKCIDCEYADKDGNMLVCSLHLCDVAEYDYCSFGLRKEI